MRIEQQVEICILFAKVSANSNDLYFSSIIDKLCEFSDNMQNLWWLFWVAFTIFVFSISPFLFWRKTNKFTRAQVDRLISNGKYIPGIFVELNESKEIVRYFIYSEKWKIRMINRYNFVYDNAYGDILKKACDNSGVKFHLGRFTSMKVIESVVNAALELHSNFRESKVKFKDDYKESQVLFEILYHPYEEALKCIQQYCKAANVKYFILTGSAGNGKTNLLCSVSELLIALKEPTIFLNARDIEGDVLNYVFSKLSVPSIFQKHKDIYLCLVNLLLNIQDKYLFVIVDAVNENDSDDFSEQIVTFIRKIIGYSRVKVIISCRNEYYVERFRESLVKKVGVPAFEYDLKEQQYTPVAIDQIIRAYREYFDYNGYISSSVRNALSEQLLLLRIFFEVNKHSNVDALSIRKHEIYAQYIEMIKQNNGEYIEKVLNAVADIMIEDENYDEVSLLSMEKAGINSDVIEKTVDSGILLSKKLISHEGTIARDETEVLYFVFDEMRDYYLARRVLLKNITAYNVDGEAILEKIKMLKDRGASCTEGIIHYCYVFFRTDDVVAKLGQMEKLCNSLLDIYRIPEDREKQFYWKSHHREEFQNLGLRILLTSGLSLTNFEVLYIQDCLRKDPYEDGGILFDTMLNGTLYGGEYNIDTYLDILFGLKHREQILSAFQMIISRNSFDKKYIPQDFVKYYDELVDVDFEKAMQIQKVAELFLLCFELEDKDAEDELMEFFYNLPTHEEIQNEMILRMRKACGLEVRDYE